MKADGPSARGPPHGELRTRSQDFVFTLEQERHMKVLWINNHGGGFADYVDVAPGTTLDKFFTQRLPKEQPEDSLIRVNRQPVSRDQVLQENDRVTMTPVKIEGARAA